MRISVARTTRLVLAFSALSLGALTFASHAEAQKRKPKPKP